MQVIIVYELHVYDLYDFRNAEILANMFRRVENIKKAEYYENVRDKLKSAIR